MPYRTRKKHITIASLTIAAIVLGIVGLTFFNMRDLIFGTPLRLTVADDGTTLDSSFLPLTGNAKHARDLLINGRSVAIDRSGNFADAVILSPGYNTIQVALKDQFGKVRTRTYQYVYSPESAVAQTPIPQTTQ